jgi:predicted membrane channel-forming protein YqfA (hemolysin III family)
MKDSCFVEVVTIIMELFAMLMCAMAIICADQKEVLWCIFFIAMAIGSVVVMILAIKSERRAKCNLK